MHKYEQVDEAQRDNMRAGAIVVALVYLSGDAAIYEYEKGIVKDEENSLRLIRYTMTGGDPKRLNNVLTDDVEYCSVNCNEPKYGKEDTIAFIDYVRDNRKGDIIIDLATITDSDKDKDQSLVGKRCLLIGYEGEEKYDAALLIEMDKDNNINKIYVDRLIGYSFEIDQPPELNEDNDLLKNVGLLRYAIFEEWSYDPPGGSVRCLYDSLALFNEGLLAPVEEILDHISVSTEESEYKEASAIMGIEDIADEDISNWGWDNGGVGCGCILYAKGEEIVEKAIQFYHDEMEDYVKDKYYYDEDDEEDCESRQKMSKITDIIEKAQQNPGDYDSVTTLINMISEILMDHNESYCC